VQQDQQEQLALPGVPDLLDNKVLRELLEHLAQLELVVQQGRQARKEARALRARLALLVSADQVVRQDRQVQPEPRASRVSPVQQEPSPARADSYPGTSL